MSCEYAQYSVGEIYLIANLPRYARNRVENLNVIGCIPGPREPQHTMNTYLSLMVDELEDRWGGIHITIPISVRAALIGVVCDIPACHTVCGFTGFQAKLCCSKCLTKFPSGSFGEKLDYSGFQTFIVLCQY